jgi:hypothetical protein
VRFFQKCRFNLVGADESQPLWDNEAKEEPKTPQGL